MLRIALSLALVVIPFVIKEIDENERVKRDKKE
jgi:hypothetical protein